MKFDYNLKYYHFLLLFCVIALNVCGIFIVRSAANMDDSIVSRQIFGTLTGVCLCIFVSFFDYRKLLKYANGIYVLAVIALVAVLLWGAVHKGAGRWIVLPIIGQIQPAEFAKVALILFFAAFFEKNREELNRLPVLLKSIALFGVLAALIFVEPNLSTTIIVGVIFAGVLFAAGLSFRWIGLALAVIAIVVSAFLYTFRTDLYQKVPFIQDYQKQRILGFLNPDEYGNISLQQQNSIMAIGSGGLEGKGLNNTDIGSVKAGNFLIEEDTDFIFAIIGEELGFRGCILIFAGFILVILLVLRTGSRAGDTGGKLICVGIATWLAFQTFTNVAVATALFPTTGVTLPFFSRGVSSLISLYIGIGIVLNVGLQRKSVSKPY